MANPDVLFKKAAATEWVHQVNESKQFGTWRYLLASESDIAASPNWEALTTRAATPGPKASEAIVSTEHSTLK